MVMFLQVIRLSNKGAILLVIPSQIHEIVKTLFVASPGTKKFILDSPQQMLYSEIFCKYSLEVSAQKKSAEKC